MKEENPKWENSGDRLEAVLTDSDDGPDGSIKSIRWEADVPVAGNPFMMVDFLRCEVITALAVAAMAGIPQWFYGGMGAAQAAAILRLCVAGMLLFALGLFAVGFLILRNGFYALFVLNGHHIYWEARRRKREAGVLLGCRPRPAGTGALPRAFSREILWRKADSFTGFPSMRTILEKRGVWEIPRLYMPDNETYEKVRKFLLLRLREHKP
jgi:hypothetical protein